MTKFDTALANWHALNLHLSKFKEAELAQLIAQEMAGGKRLTFVLRIHMRLNKLRGKRERAELRSKFS